MKKVFQKLRPRIVSFSNEAFRNLLLNKLSKEVFLTNDDSLQRFCCINIDVLNKHELRKKNHARGNQMSFMTKDLSKAIQMKTRSCIQNNEITVSLSKTIQKQLFSNLE